MFFSFSLKIFFIFCLCLSVSFRFCLLISVSDYFCPFIFVSVSLCPLQCQFLSKVVLNITVYILTMTGIDLTGLVINMSGFDLKKILIFTNNHIPKEDGKLCPSKKKHINNIVQIAQLVRVNLGWCVLEFCHLFHVCGLAVGGEEKSLSDDT